MCVVKRPARRAMAKSKKEKKRRKKKIAAKDREEGPERKSEELSIGKQFSKEDKDINLYCDRKDI